MTETTVEEILEDARRRGLHLDADRLHEAIQRGRREAVEMIEAGQTEPDETELLDADENGRIVVDLDEAVASAQDFLNDVRHAGELDLDTLVDGYGGEEAFFARVAEANALVENGAGFARKIERQNAEEDRLRQDKAEIAAVRKGERSTGGKILKRKP